MSDDLQLINHGTSTYNLKKDEKPGLQINNTNLFPLYVVSITLI